ncbi:hypothetical protein SISSUDRAFT_1038491 [Sistotremastrum suecicum HHB10207 ss-3]|uniref:HAT C-terminal dimerisation domain-containing protein n=1 Tax=Sistotremastrum suecicum HHB10207 ss-3 TaxID=1314776 RepID=A0A165WNG0_9AGAM|nr:hypothetical protein SISSUDRAFT_1038491 [Sistotremastrum suecicum HHB10207 ss-3]
MKAKKWKKKWIRESERIVREIWERDYLPHVVVKKKVAKPSTDNFMDFNISDYAHLTAPPSITDPLTKYLAKPTLDNVTDPLEYWDSQRSSKVYDPQFIQMAKDYCSAPASSVDAERAFSLAGRIVTPLRSSLGDKHIRMTVLLNSWFTMPGLISEEEFEQHWWKDGKEKGRGRGRKRRRRRGRGRGRPQ